MKKCGFTLIELLVVIILIAAIVLLALPKITNSVKNNSTNVDKITFNLIKEATKLYVSDNENSFIKRSENTYCVSLNELIEKDYLKNNVQYNNQDITNTKVMKITYNNGFNYELVDKEDCEKVIKFDTVCELVSGEEKTIGSKYECNFGGGVRNFYILELGSNPVTGSTLKSDEVALILEGNYDTSAQPFCNQSGLNPSNGQLCKADGLTEKLGEISNEWSALDRKQIGLPSVVQIVVADGRNEDEYLSSPTLTNTWLYNWPDNSNYGKEAPSGYWTLSHYTENSSRAWYVRYNGLVSNSGVIIAVHYGVRPVITLEL